MMEVKSVVTFQSQGTRATQQDSFLVIKERGIFILADGFGGGDSGFEVSQLVCHSVRQFLIKEAGDAEATLPFILRKYFTLGGNVLFNSLVYANRKILEFNRKKKLDQKGGASAMSAYLDGNTLSLASVGTTVAYLLREGEMERLNVPRSLGRMLNPIGLRLKVEDQIPLAALGMWEDFEPEIFELKIYPGDMLCLASSGVGDVWVDQVLESVRYAVQSKNDKQSFVSQALSEVFERQKFSDNASFVLVGF